MRRHARQNGRSLPEASRPQAKAPVTDQSSVEARPPEPPTRRTQIPLAILYMVAAGAIFSGSSAASKWLVATYPVGEVLFTRAFLSLLLFSAFILPTPRARRVPHPPARRAPAARRLADHLAGAAADRVQHDAAGERDRDQLLGAAVCDADVVSFC